jgi:dTDP-4-dehydrorhamnose reductase
MKRLLVTGGNGLLGSKIINTSNEKYEVAATYYNNPLKIKNNLFPLNITKKEDISQLFKKTNPDHVIHTAAMTDVDYCENHLDEARKVNVEGTKNIGELCKDAGARLIFISTDFVFDGKKGHYSEEEVPNPINNYGKTKLEAERELQKLNFDCIIARVSVLYGWNLIEKPNFVTWLIEELKKNRNVNIVEDQWNSPTYADNCAEILQKLLKFGKPGIYHTSGSERISRLEFAKKIAYVFGLNQLLIKKTKTTFFAQKARRPQDSSLSIERLIRELGEIPLGTKQGLMKMKKQYK